MNYHDKHAINDAVLAIINDGDGSMCGMSYKDRCRPDVVQHGIIHYRNAVRTYSRYAVTHFEATKLRRQDQIIAADRIQAYYREHLKELAEGGA